MTGGETLERAVADVAAFGLNGAQPPQSYAPGQDWTVLRAHILGQRITGLAVASAEDGWLNLEDEQKDELLAAHVDAMTWAVRVEQKAVRLADAFDRAGIEFALLKGASVAHRAYEDPSLRSFGDVDLLVRTTDYEAACALLGSLGHVRQRPEPRPHFEVRFGKGSVHVHPGDGIEVDLHRTLVLGPFGLWTDPEELMDRAVPFQLGGRELMRLDDTGMFVNVVMHAALGWEVPRLVPLRDVAELAVRDDLDQEALRLWAKQWRLVGVLRNAAVEVRRQLGIDVPPVLAAWEMQSIQTCDERLLAAYESRRRSGGIALSTVVAIRGLRAKGAYVWAVAVPRREFLRVRDRTTYLRRWSVPLRWVRAKN